LRLSSGFFRHGLVGRSFLGRSFLDGSLRLSRRLFGHGLLGRRLGSRLFDDGLSLGGSLVRLGLYPRLFDRLGLHRGLLSCLFVLAHAPAFSASRSVTTVRMRAISRLASFRRAEFSSEPVTDWKRRLKSSFLRSASRSPSSSSVNERSS